jgi:hypothetical protein
VTPDYDTFLQALAEYQDFLENRGPFEGSTDPRRHDAPLMGIRILNFFALDPKLVPRPEV